MYNNKKISIFFGDAESSISTDDIKRHLATESLQHIARSVGADQIVFLQQEHTDQGLYITHQDDKNYLFDQIGDYIMTQKKSCAIGVVTADCLPIIIYDPCTETVSIVHAGWKGLANKIIQKVFQRMVDEFFVQPCNVELYLGPGAQGCCYEVQQDFVEQFIEFQDYFDLIFIQKDDTIYFDSAAFIRLIARNLGINEEKIYTKYNLCTICNILFCSYRREKEKARRQISMVCLA